MRTNTFYIQSWKHLLILPPYGLSINQCFMNTLYLYYHYSLSNIWTLSNIQREIPLTYKEPSTDFHWFRKFEKKNTRKYHQLEHCSLFCLFSESTCLIGTFLIGHTVPTLVKTWASTKPSADDEWGKEFQISL